MAQVELGFSPQYWAPMPQNVSPLRPTQQGPSGNEDDNERKNREDLNICRQFTGRLARACYASATARDGARRNGKAVPPLITSLYVASPGAGSSVGVGSVAAGAGLLGAGLCLLAEPCGAAVSTALGLGGLGILATQ